jgi:integrase
MAKAGIENFRWHDLRHTFASRLAMSSVDIRTIASLMGHKDLMMVMRYAHLSPEHELEAVSRLVGFGTSPKTDTATSNTVQVADKVAA